MKTRNLESTKSILSLFRIFTCPVGRYYRTGVLRDFEINLSFRKKFEKMIHNELHRWFVDVKILTSFGKVCQPG